MKKTLTFSLITAIAVIGLSLTSDQLADTYTVIKVDGSITYEKSGKNMNRGDKFESSEKLKFQTTVSRAAVISKLKGRFVLTPKQSNTSKSNLLPAMSNVSSRKGEILNLIDLKNYFAKNLLLLSKSEVKLKVKEYPMNEDNFFYLTYEVNGTTIPKKLGFMGDDVLLERDSIFRVDGQPIKIETSTEVKLYHRSAKDKKSVIISEFNIVAPNQVDLVEELKIVKSEGKPEDFRNNAIAYLAEFYGKIDKDELEAWMLAKEL
jgi:hypothetical protein